MVFFSPGVVREKGRFLLLPLSFFSPLRFSSLGGDGWQLMGIGGKGEWGYRVDGNSDGSFGNYRCFPMGKIGRRHGFATYCMIMTGELYFLGLEFLNYLFFNRYLLPVLPMHLSVSYDLQASIAM